MKNLTDNHYIKAAIGVVLLSAFTHTTILMFYSLVNMDITALNLFRILDLDLYFPKISGGLVNFIWSYLFLGAEYLVIFYLLRKK